jgi:hypothetical protein
MRSVVDRNVVMRRIPVLLLRLSKGHVQKNRHQDPGSFLVSPNSPLNFDSFKVKSLFSVSYFLPKQDVAFYTNVQGLIIGTMMGMIPKISLCTCKGK